MIYLQRPYYINFDNFLEIKGFKTDSDLIKFHQNRDTSKWSNYKGPLKSGKYKQEGWNTVNGKLVPQWKKI